MSTDVSGRLKLSDDVLVIPVAELPDEARAQIDCDPGDFAVSRLQSRNGSKIVDPDAAEVLSRFREPRTVVEAVILFARERELEPDKVLEAAYPFLRSMVEAGFLVPAAAPAEGDAQASRTAAHWSVGATVLGATVARTLQVLDDTEVYLLARRGGRQSVLKTERLRPDGRSIGSAGSRLAHEAAFLAHLGGEVAPALLGRGELEGRAYLELELIEGVDAAAAAAEWRERDSADARRELLALVRAVAMAYAAVHARGIVHGDVHTRNVLVDGHNRVRLIDFGVARPTTSADALPVPPERGGVPFFFEPELAAAYRDGAPAPAATEAGEQHAVATLIYFLVTGAYWQDFRLGREAMLEDIATRVPLRFRDRAVAPWPELEAVLERALAKAPAERFPSMAALAAAIAAVPERTAPTHPPEPARIGGILDEAIALAALDGAWNRASLAPAPTTSLNYGSTGIALGLLHVAQRRGDAEALALADLWSKRALGEMAHEGAFFNADIEITREIVGESSPYHSPSGVFAVAALVATARADPQSMAAGVAGFLDAARSPAPGLDLTLGRCSVLLGAAILLDAVRSNGLIDAEPLRAFGDDTLAQVWQALDAKPPVIGADIEYVGIAHGWAGMLYATLQWCDVSGRAIPAGVTRRLDELAELALPAGRGVEWPWLLRRSGEPMTMAGWCNGTCGYVFLWTLAHRLLAEPRYGELARGAAWRSWDAAETMPTLCCGLAGRAYALLNIYRYTGETVWLDRARDLASRSAQDSTGASEYPHSLYKGKFGLAVLAVDLEQPSEARMPFFEPMGYRP